MFTGQKHDNRIYLDWRGEWINYDGDSASDDDLLAFATACGVTLDSGSKTISGSIYCMGTLI